MCDLTLIGVSLGIPFMQLSDHSLYIRQAISGNPRKWAGPYWDPMS